MQTAASFLPYCGAAPIPAEFWMRWNFDPVLLSALAIAFVALRRTGARPLPATGALLLLLLLFVSPLCALSSALFSMRAAHHLLLTAVAAPLIALSLPRGRPAGLLGWTAAHAVTFWAWHAPQAYALALSNDGAYWLMQITLIGPAIGFWRCVIASPPTVAVGGLLATMVQMGLLGALLTFAGTALYAPHFASTAAWGLTALEDQQLAGLLMWVPGAATYLGAALWMTNGWLTAQQKPATT